MNTNPKKQFFCQITGSSNNVIQKPEDVLYASKSVRTRKTKFISSSNNIDYEKLQYKQ